jgi:hypothetical protein
VVCTVVELLDESSLPRTISHTTNAAASAIATTTPMRMLGRRAQVLSLCSVTPREE